MTTTNDYQNCSCSHYHAKLSNPNSTLLHSPHSSGFLKLFCNVVRLQGVCKTLGIIVKRNVLLEVSRILTNKCIIELLVIWVPTCQSSSVTPFLPRSFYLEWFGQDTTNCLSRSFVELVVLLAQPLYKNVWGCSWKNSASSEPFGFCLLDHRMILVLRPCWVERGTAVIETQG